MKPKNRKKRLEARTSNWDNLRETAEKDKKGGQVKYVGGPKGFAFKRPGSLNK